jgi:hypothetical protein
MPEGIRTPPGKNKKNGLALSIKQKASVVSTRRTLFVFSCDWRLKNARPSAILFDRRHGDSHDFTPTRSVADRTRRSKRTNRHPVRTSSPSEETATGYFLHGVVGYCEALCPVNGVGNRLLVVFSNTYM